MENDYITVETVTENNKDIMDYSHLLEELNTASLFDLYRLSVAIDHQLDNPQRIKDVKSRLKPDMEITFFDNVKNRLVPATVIRLDRTYVLVHSQEDCAIP